MRKRLRPMVAAVALTLAVVWTGCSSPRTGAGRENLAGGDWVEPSGSRRTASEPDRAAGLLGLPPFWFYESGPDGYVAIPPLATYHSDRFHFVLLGVGSLGWTSEGPAPEGDGEGYSTVDWDFNLAAFYNSRHERIRMASRVVERRSYRILWGLPIYSQETTRTATGTSVRSWIFGGIPVD